MPAMAEPLNPVARGTAVVIASGCSDTGNSVTVRAGASVEVVGTGGQVIDWTGTLVGASGAWVQVVSWVEILGKEGNEGRAQFSDTLRELIRQSAETRPGLANSQKVLLMLRGTGPSSTRV